MTLTNFKLKEAWWPCVFKERILSILYRVKGIIIFRDMTRSAERATISLRHKVAYVLRRVSASQYSPSKY